LLGPAATEHDNLKYLHNTARWLEQNGNSASGSNIAICDLSEGRAGTVDPKVITSLTRNGFKVTLAGKGTPLKLTDKALAGYGQLWLIFDSSSRLSNAELSTVSKFADDGKGMLIVSGPGGAGELSGPNQLSTRYGVSFSGDVDNRAELSTGIASSMFGEASVVLGRFLKLVHKG
jgi:hypothetical protein